MELHFFFFFLMEVNSCLTILPSDVFSRELGKQTTAWGMQPEECVAAAVLPAFTPVSLEEIGSASLTHQSYAMTCCFNISRNVLGENLLFACARLCSFWAVYWNAMYSHLRRACRAGGNTRSSHLKEQKPQNSREKQCVDFESNTSFFMSFSLPKHFCHRLFIFKVERFESIIPS